MFKQLLVFHVVGAFTDNFDAEFGALRGSSLGLLLKLSDPPYFRRGLLGAWHAGSRHRQPFLF